MIFNELTYRQKNKFLLLGSGVLFLLSWILSFSKSWNAYNQNKSLVAQATSSAISNESTYTIQHKFRAVDSLVKAFSKDSVEFENNFLTNISQGLKGLPIELSYQAKPHPTESLNSKTIILKGDYKSIIQALERIEKKYFVGRVQFDNGTFQLEIN